MVKLGDYIKLIGGGTPSKKVDAYWNGSIPWASVKDLKSDYLTQTVDTITQEGLSKSTSRLIPANSLVISTRMAVGKAVITEIDTAINQDLKAVIPTSELDQKFLFYLFKAKVQYFESVSTGATVKGIKIQHLNDLTFPLPPLPTQTRIARALDLADRHRRLLREELDAYDELGESLFLEMFGDPVRNPQKTDFVKLGELGLWKSGGTPSRGNSKYFTGSIPWLTSGELNQVYTTKSNESITEEALSNSSARIAETGSLFLGMYDTAALKSTISTLPVSCNQAIAFTKLNVDLVDTLYVYYALQIGKEEFKKLQRGVRQKNLNLSMVKNIKIPLPPLTLQKEFANRIKKINLLKAKTQTTLKEADDLFNVLLQRAFRGELFPEATAAG
jgi:type I restriction enzyme S subunit